MPSAWACISFEMDSVARKLRMYKDGAVDPILSVDDHGKGCVAPTPVRLALVRACRHPALRRRVELPSDERAARRVDRRSGGGHQAGDLPSSIGETSGMVTRLTIPVFEKRLTFWAVHLKITRWQPYSCLMPKRPPVTIRDFAAVGILLSSFVASCGGNPEVTSGPALPDAGPDSSVQSESGPMSVIRLIDVSVADTSKPSNQPPMDAPSFSARATPAATAVS